MTKDEQSTGRKRTCEDLAGDADPRRNVQLPRERKQRFLGRSETWTAGHTAGPIPVRERSSNQCWERPEGAAW